MESDPKELEGRLKDIGMRLQLGAKRRKIEELTKQMEDPNFWKDTERSKLVVKELSELKQNVERFDRVVDKIRGLSDLYLEISQLGDQDLVEAFRSYLQEVTSELHLLELDAYLSGKYDYNNAILHIHAGQGGTEACDWAAMLMRMYQMYFNKRGWKSTVAEIVRGNEAGVSKVVLEVEGEFAYGYLKGESGVHRLVRISPFNAQGLRQTSFAGVEVLPVIETDIEVNISPEDVDIWFSKSGGPGGQNVNQVHSKVTVVHRPTGIQVQCDSERSQHQNRELAMKMLRAKLYQMELDKKVEEELKLKGEHRVFGWGNQIRNYVLHPYKLVKDLRTGVESYDPESVLDGNLDDFINAEVKLTFND